MAIELFPLGIWHYLIGGLLVGLGISFIFLTTGIITGTSSVFSSTWSYFSKLKYFQQEAYSSARLWRLVFSAGLIIGAFIFAFWNNNFFTTQVQWWRLAIGGFLVGYGARLSRGCTSGHGICGISSFSLPSLMAVVTFMAIAILTAYIVSLFGVLP